MDKSEKTGDNTEVDWDIAYKELHRRADYQIETNRWLSNLAVKLLRFILTLMIISITFISVVVKVLSSGKLSLDIISLEIEPLISDTASAVPYLHDNLVLIAVTIMLISAVFLFPFALNHIFITVPTNAIKVLSWRSFTPSLRQNQIEILDSSHSDRRTKRKTLEGYNEIIESNQESLEEARHQWEQCYNYLWKGFRWFIASATVFISMFIVQEPIMVFLALFMLLALPIQYITERITYSDIKPYLTLKAGVDGPLLIIGLSSFLLVLVERIADSFAWTDMAYSIIAIVGSLIIIYKSYSYNNRMVATLFVRTLGVSVMIFISYFFFFINFNSQKSVVPRFDVLIDIFQSLLFSSLVGVLLFVIGYGMEKLFKNSGAEANNQSPTD